MSEKPNPLGLASAKILTLMTLVAKPEADQHQFKLAVRTIFGLPPPPVSGEVGSLTCQEAGVYTDSEKAAVTSDHGFELPAAAARRPNKLVEPRVAHFALFPRGDPKCKSISALDNTTRQLFLLTSTLCPKLLYQHATTSHAAPGEGVDMMIATRPAQPYAPACASQRGGMPCDSSQRAFLQMEQHLAASVSNLAIDTYQPRRICHKAVQ